MIYAIIATESCFSLEGHEEALRSARAKIIEWIKAPMRAMASDDLLNMKLVVQNPKDIFAEYPDKPLSFYLYICTTAFVNSLSRMVTLYPNSLPITGLNRAFSHLDDIIVFQTHYPPEMVSFLEKKSNQAPWFSLVAKVIEIAESTGLHKQSLEAASARLCDNPLQMLPIIGKQLFDLFKIVKFLDDFELVSRQYTDWIHTVLIDLLNDVSVPRETAAQIFRELLKTNCLTLLTTDPEKITANLGAVGREESADSYQTAEDSDDQVFLMTPSSDLAVNGEHSVPPVLHMAEMLQQEDDVRMRSPGFSLGEDDALQSPSYLA